MAENKKEVTKDNLKEYLIALDDEGMLEDLIDEIKSTREDNDCKGGRVRVNTLNGAKRRSKNNPMLGVVDNRFYAVAANNGYALYRDREKCEGQVASNDPMRLPYLRDAYVESFSTAKEAMEWIKAALEQYFGINGVKLKSVDYMLKWESYWFTKGAKMPWEKRQQNYNYNNDY